MIEATGPAAIYVRISEDRDGERLGVERQLADCRKLAKRLGWKVSEVYEDNDLSASKVKVIRPAYQRLLKDIEAGKVRRLITDKPDRLYRRNTELEHLIDVVGDRVEIRTAKSGDIDLTTVNGRMVARILGATAQAEAETTAGRVKRKMLELKTSGAWKGGPRPFGWKSDGNKGLIEVPAEIALLREAKDRILTGDSMRSIVKDWERSGVRSTRGIAIAETTLRKMLESPRLIGQYDGGIIGQWKPILAVEEWERLRAVIRGRARTRRPSQKYLLVGVLYCGECGEKMYGAPSMGGRPTPYYRCQTRVGSKACGRCAIRASKADENVMETLTNYFTSPAWRTARGDRLDHDAPALTAAVHAQAKIQGELDDLTALLGAGQMTARDWAIAKQHLDPRMKQAKAALDAAQAQAGDIPALTKLDAKHFVTHWREMSLEERQQVVRTTISSVMVNQRDREDYKGNRLLVAFR